jgi:hypothetical protein
MAVVAVREEERSSWTEEDEQAGSGVERAHHRRAVAARTLRSGRRRFGEEERSVCLATVKIASRADDCGNKKAMAKERRSHVSEAAGVIGNRMLF